MKLKGKKLQPPKPIDVVIPRGDDALHFRVQAVTDYDDFDKACPRPPIPFIMKPGEKPREMTEKDEGWKDYEKSLEEWFQQRRGWFYIKSLAATPDIEWEHIDLKDPKTWSFKNVLLELESSGLLRAEVSLILREIDKANAIDEKHIEEARKRFLSQMAASDEPSSA